MDMKMQAFLDKVKDMADKTGKVSRHAAGVAGKKANDLALATRINLQIFDLNTECEALYKEIGKLVYDLHRGAEVTNEEMDEKMAQVDAKQEKLAVLRDKLAENALGNGMPALRQNRAARMTHTARPAAQSCNIIRFDASYCNIGQGQLCPF